MSNLGPVYEDDEDYSPGRQNAKGITRDTGTNIVALAVTKQLGLVIPTDTSGGLVKNVAYYVDYDTNFNRITFEPLFHRHMHLPDDLDEDGGSYLNIRVGNRRDFGEAGLFTHYNDPAAIWRIHNTNGTIARIASGDNAYYEIDTLNTTNNFIMATLSGIKFSFGFPMSIMFTTEVTQNANILARTGVNIDRVDESPSTSRRQLAIEGCDGHGTNWVMLNANGNSGSLEVTATTIALNNSGSHNFDIEHIPATEDRLYHDNVSNAVSSTNVPDDGNTTYSRLFRWGIKLPAGTTAIKQRLWWWRVLGNHTVF